MFISSPAAQDPSVALAPSRMTNELAVLVVQTNASVTSRGFLANVDSARHPRAKRKRSEGSCAADKYKNLSFNTNHHPDKSKFEAIINIKKKSSYILILIIDFFFGV